MKRFLLTIAVAAILIPAAPNHAFGTQSPEPAPTTLTAVTTTDPTITVTANRTATYQNPDAPTYTYTVTVAGIDSIEGETCLLTHQGVTLDELPCDQATQGFARPLTENGNYVVTIQHANETLAAWTFTRPADIPAPLSEATCTVIAVKARTVNKTTTTLQLTAKGCATSNGTFTLTRPNGTVIPSKIKGLTFTPIKPAKTFPVKRGQKIIVTYIPAELIKNTVATLTVR